MTISSWFGLERDGEVLARVLVQAREDLLVHAPRPGPACAPGRRGRGPRRSPRGSRAPPARSGPCPRGGAGRPRGRRAADSGCIGRRGRDPPWEAVRRDRATPVEPGSARLRWYARRRAGCGSARPRRGRSPTTNAGGIWKPTYLMSRSDFCRPSFTSSATISSDAGWRASRFRRRYASVRPESTMSSTIRT